MSDLVAEIINMVDGKSDLRIDDAVATGANTVTVGSSTVAVTLPAIIPVAAGDFCQVLTQGPNRVILGPVSTGWTTITLADANWTVTRPLQWRLEGNRVWLRGALQRITSQLAVGTGVFFSTTNPPMPTQINEYPMYSYTTQFEVNGGWVVNPAGFLATSTVDVVAVGHSVYFDHISWAVN